MLAVTALLIGGVLIVAVRAAGQADAVSRAGSATFTQVEAVRIALLQGDVEQARVALADAQRSARTGSETSSGPLWRTLGGLPRIGNNFRTSAGLMAEGRHLTDVSLPVIVEAAVMLQSQAQPSSNGVDLATPDLPTVDRALAELHRGMDDLTGTRRRVDQLPTDGLTGPVAASRAAVLEGIDAAVSTLTSSQADYRGSTVPAG